jgi:hypothetical protein
MWDSLESIYFAAKNDPDCDVYVVPLPFYELNPDRTLGKMHYEGDDYNVDTVNRQEYDVEARRPDIVFTHYAYDDQAQNDSIHPDFYSKRLREFCNMLIYVPYFVMGDSIPDHFVCLPGILYAHKVIVQDEAARQEYIKHYEWGDKEYGWNGQFGKAEEKFIALGSPKFDKLFLTLTMRHTNFTAGNFHRIKRRFDGVYRSKSLFSSKFRPILVV